MAQLKGVDGVTSLLSFMDLQLGKDNLEDAWYNFTSFEDFKKTDAMSMGQYIIEFDQLYQRLKNKGIILPPSILAFKLIRGASLSRDVNLLIKTGLDMSKPDDMYKDAKVSLKKFRGDVIAGTSNVDSDVHFGSESGATAI